MKVELHNHLGRPQVIECTRLVVLDAYDNPISVSIEYQRDLIITSHVGQHDFHNLLRQCGITKTVVVTQAMQKPLEEIRFPQDGS